MCTHDRACPFDIFANTDRRSRWKCRNSLCKFSLDNLIAVRSVLPCQNLRQDKDSCASLALRIRPPNAAICFPESALGLRLRREPDYQ